MAEVKKIATRESYGATLAELSTEYPNLVVLDADLAGAPRQLPLKRCARSASSTAASPRAT